MTKLLSLIRVGLKANFGFAVLRQRIFVERKDLWLIPVILLSCLSLWPIGFLYLRMAATGYELLSPLGQQHLLLLFIILAGQLFVIIFGLYYVISAFYFSRDVEILVPLPLEPLQVMLSKFAVILVNEYLTLAPLVLPLFIYYGILAKAGPGYWLNALAVYLLLPVIPLTIVSLLVIGMMRVVNLSRKKDLLIVVGSIFLMALIFGMQFLIGRAAGGFLDAKNIVRILSSPDGLLNRAGASFPPSVWATKAITGGLSRPGIMNLLFLAGVSLLLFWGILLVSGRLFYSGLIGVGEITSRRVTLSKEKVSRMVGSGGSPLKAIFLRELRIMNRTPIFLLNGIGAVVLIPVLLALVPFSGSRGLNSSPLAVLASHNPAWVILGAACFLTVCGCLNGTASSTFSREGFQFWISKVIPVSPGTQVIAKFIHSYIVALLGIAFSSGMLAVLFRPRLTTWAGALPLAIVASFALTAIGMIIDLARPLLDWTNPQKAMKQNLNVLLAILIDIGVIAALGFFSRYLGKSGMQPIALVLVLLTLLLLFSFSSFIVLLRFAEKRYAEIEV
jgi:ABC-2 type transport system permease protein